MSLLQHEGHACKLTHPMLNMFNILLEENNDSKCKIISSLKLPNNSELRYEKIRKILPQLNKSLYMVSFVMNLILSQIHTKKTTTEWNGKAYSCNLNTYQFIKVSIEMLTLTLSSLTLPSATWQQYQKWLTIGSIHSSNSPHPLTLAAFQKLLITTSIDLVLNKKT